MAERQMDFEEALRRLEEIVETMESGELPLEEALRLFEEGMELSRLCTRRLDEVEARIEVLWQGEDGRRVLRPLDELEGRGSAGGRAEEGAEGRGDGE
ncbi:MAG: exodeoxyribonuclease VII small subunit [Bacillota bacterium]|nr:exodeoxyribonuclease VII small subunit [Bacillota bacterium]